MLFTANLITHLVDICCTYLIVRLFCKTTFRLENIFCLLVVFTTWVLLYIIKDIANDSVMSSKMANLFSMKSNYWLFGIVSAVMGILGGLTGVAGYYLSKKS